MFIRGENIELRAIEPEDLEYITDLLNAPKVSTCLFGYPMNFKAAKFSEWFEQIAINRNAFCYAVKETQGFTTIGVCAYLEIDYKNGSTTVCVALDPNYADNKYGPDVLRALCNHAFNRLRIEHISMYCLENNLVTKNWALDAGFCEEALLYSRIKMEDKRMNIILYGLLKEEGESQNE